MISAGGYDFQPAGPSIRRTGENRWIRIGGTRSKILALLMRRPGSVITYENIADTIWPSKRPNQWKQQIRVRVLALRQAMMKAGGSSGDIRVVHNVGYLLFDHSAAPAVIYLDPDSRRALDVVLASAEVLTPHAVKTVREALNVSGA